MDKKTALRAITSHYEAMPEVRGIARIKVDDSNALNIAIITTAAERLFEDCDEFFEDNFDYFRSFKEAADGVFKFGMMTSDFLELEITFMLLDIWESHHAKGAADFLYAASELDTQLAAPQAKTNITRDLISLQDKIWTNFKATLDAISDDQPLRAMKEIELARNLIVTTMCKKLGADPSHWRGTTRFDKATTAKLISTFPAAANSADILSAFDNLFLFFIDMLQENGMTLHASEYVDFFKEYKLHLAK